MAHQTLAWLEHSLSTLNNRPRIAIGYSLSVTRDYMLNKTTELIDYLYTNGRITKQRHSDLLTMHNHRDPELKDQLEQEYTTT